MSSRLWIINVIVLSSLFVLSAYGSTLEKLDRGLVAIERENGSAFLNWRLLERYPEDIYYPA